MFGPDKLTYLNAAHHPKPTTYVGLHCTTTLTNAYHLFIFARSRYTAFSWRNIDYVMSTTHELCRDFRDDKVAWAKDLDKKGMFDSFDFIQLTPGEEEMSQENENEGFVEFKVKLRAKDDSDYVAGQETVITERSKFIRDPNDGSWKYASGDV